MPPATCPSIHLVLLLKLLSVVLQTLVQLEAMLLRTASMVTSTAPTHLLSYLQVWATSASEATRTRTLDATEVLKMRRAQSKLSSLSIQATAAMTSPWLLPISFTTQLDVEPTLLTIFLFVYLLHQQTVQKTLIMSWSVLVWQAGGAGGCDMAWALDDFTDFNTCMGKGLAYD
jgi:hypothetical protein